MQTGTIKVYGTDWCPMTQGTLRYLDGLGAAYSYIDIDSDPEGAAWVRSRTGGKETKPTVLVGDQVLIEPTDNELGAALADKRMAAAS